MYKDICKALKTASYNVKTWRGNIRIIAVFVMAFILCFLLTDQIVRFAAEHDMSLQMVEAFIWSFGDSKSILLSSLLLMLLYSDMPFVTRATPFFLVRQNRKSWMFGQFLYIVFSTMVYLSFILISTCILSAKYSFPKNTWSKTAAVLAYSREGDAMSMPVEVKTLEMSRPFQCMAHIFLLMVLYTLVMVFLMMVFSLWKGHVAGFAAGIVFNLYGMLLNPDQLQKILNLPEEAYYEARLYLGWLSPLNQATFSMHNFGYDRLPKLWQTYGIFLVTLTVLLFFAMWCMRQYNYNFMGTER
ncbi:MAG: hypothetical protein NC347_03705 [Clostridium sp.]|nr:hypothetical protein [Clostridium sp.]